MTRWFEFAFTADGLEETRFIVRRDALPTNGDCESAFLEDGCDFVRHPTYAAFGDVLRTALSDNGTNLIVVVRNPNLVLDPMLRDRILAARKSLPANDAWSIAGGGGLGPNERRHLALYSTETPTLPDPTGPHPLLDVMPDLLLINADFARDVLSGSDRMADMALEPILATEGYLAGRAALYLPDLVAAINGPLIARDLNRLSAELDEHFGKRLAGTVIPTLAGSVHISDHDGAEGAPPSSNGPRIDVAKSVEKTLARMSAPLGLSVVVRTRFDRAHLLDRLLTSISRARRDDVDMEIILSTDIDPADAERHLSSIGKRFCSLTIRLQHNSDDQHSRVRNLVGGLMSAEKDFVVLIDDDDYVDLFAFDVLTQARFAGRMPLIVTASDVHDETWEETPSARWVVSRSTLKSTYRASGWRSMFSGVNQLPVCAFILPRLWMQKRLSAFHFNHDLSEDYALYLLLLTDPNLPEIYESEATFGHISIRDADNSVTMPDRRPWARDISNFLYDLTTKTPVCGPGVWQLLQADRHGPETAVMASEVAAQARALEKARNDIRLLSLEVDVLRERASKSMEVAP